MTSITVACRAAALMALAAGPMAQGAEPDPWQTISPGGDTVCATGTPYSFHVRHGASERVMIYLRRCLLVQRDLRRHRLLRA